MKNLIFKLFAIGIVLLFITNCENFLAEKPRDSLSPINFFNSDLEAKAAVNGLYHHFEKRQLYNPEGLLSFYMFGADEMGPNRPFATIEPLMEYTLAEGNTAGANNAWRELYKIIQDANVIISRVEENENLSSSAREQYLGETLFLRSFAYYHLTNLWGDVPYYRDDLPLSEIQVLGRTNKVQIHEEILADLQHAQNLLPNDYVSSELGRATKWAAATLEAKIYLIQESWQAARNKSVEIINESPHALLSDYGAVFDYQNEYNEEIIFQLDFAKDFNPTIITDHFTPRIRDEPLNDSDRQDLENLLAERNEGMTGFGLAIPLPDLVNSYPDDDLRKPWNAIQNYLGFDLTFPYMQKKWNLHQIDSPRNNHGENFQIFRLADVYLMAAEAENELNGPNGAYQYINAVRERAYDPDQPLSGLSQQQFREAVYHERKLELAGEGHRRLDLIRWGILIDVIHNLEGRHYNPASNIQPHHVLLPIPLEEIQLNPALLDSDPTNNGYR